MQMLAAISQWLGRKFILCVIGIFAVCGVYLYMGAPVSLFGDLCIFVGSVVIGFLGGNVAAGKFGLPGKSAKDTKDGGHGSE